MSELETLQNSVPEVAAKFDTKDKIDAVTKGKNRITPYFESELRKYLVEPNVDKLAVAIYVDGILNFLNMRANHFAAGPRGLPDHVPMFLRSKIFRDFTDDG